MKYLNVTSTNKRRTNGRIQKNWSHPSVLGLINKTGVSDPIEAIRRKAKEQVARAKKFNWSGPPYDPLELASLMGIKHCSSTNLFSAEAQLTPVDKYQLLIEFNPERSESRKNYSICHEIVHTFFDDCYDMIHQRNHNPKKFDPNQEIEYLCQVGASEILMPEDDFIEDLSRLSFSLQSVPYLVEKYIASREAVVRRMLYFAKIPCAMVLFSKRLKPVEKKHSSSKRNSIPEPRMRVLYTVHSHDFPLYIPEHKSVPDCSCVNRTQNVDQAVNGIESWELNGFTNFYVEAMALPIPENDDEDIPSVLALIFPNRNN